MNALEEHEVFLFDVDGTLASPGGMPDDRCLTALAALLSLGKHVGIVTARALNEIDYLWSLLGDRVDARLLPDHLRLFVSSATAVYAPAEGKQSSRLVEAFAQQEETDLITAIASRVRAIPSVEVIDRGAQQTILSLTDGAAQRVARLIAAHRREIRVLRVAPNCVHILPKTAGKHRAVEYYRRYVGDRKIVAFGDGFYQISEADICGNDMDFVHTGATCIQVGLVKPRDPRVHYLPLGAEGPESTARVLDRMRTLTMRELGRHPLPRGDAADDLEVIVSQLAIPQTVKSFFTKLRDYAAMTLEPLDLERRTCDAAALLRAGAPLIDAAHRLTIETPIHRAFGRWAGFEGELDWTLRWLWDEHLARPGVPIAAHCARRVRVPLLPEELCIGLLRALPPVHRGDQVIFIGKDAECLVPIFKQLVNGFQARGLISNAREPLGLKVSARKSSAPDEIDAAEHLEAGSLARQLLSMLEPSERDEVLPAAARERALSTVTTLSACEQEALHVAFQDRFGDALSQRTRGDLLKRITSSKPASDFERFVALSRDLMSALNSLEHQNGCPSASTEALLGDLPAARTYASSLAERYRTVVGSTRVESDADVDTLRDVFNEFLGARYSNLRDYEFPFTALLAALMAGTRISAILSGHTLFVDASCNSGTTVLFLRAIRHIVAPDSRFDFAMMGGIPLHDSLRADLDWCGHDYVPVLMEEGAPHTFDFYYDAEDSRISYSSRLSNQRESPASAAISAAHIDALREQHATIFATYADLEEAGLDFRDLIRWWIRRDRVWEMRVLCDQLRFRWPHARTVRNQQRAIALLHDLDSAIDEATRDRVLAMDQELNIIETHVLLEEWIARREKWLSRAAAVAEQMLDPPVELREYLAAPSLAQWRKLLRVLMATLTPEPIFTEASSQSSARLGDEAGSPEHSAA